MCKFKSQAVLNLPPEELDILENNRVEVEFRTGEILFKQNSFCTHVIFIKSGIVKIHKEGHAGKDQIFKISPAPSFLGLTNLFGDTINNYSVTAIEATSACFIQINTFKNFISTNGNFALEIIKKISRDELAYFNKFVNQKQKQVNGRLAETLLFFLHDVYKNNKFTLPLNRKDLSTLVCASRESVIREMQSLANKEIIRLKGKRVEIIDEKRLIQISRNG
ncbi:MAG: Crp/Fnr family transcriptional regulator [Bacteroidota bacterium]|nr:Crp/Fnr family transcriptional regulator [Bacteroidota bacterium]